MALASAVVMAALRLLLTDADGVVTLYILAAALLSPAGFGLAAHPIATNVLAARSNTIAGWLIVVGLGQPRGPGRAPARCRIRQRPLAQPPAVPRLPTGAPTQHSAPRRCRWRWSSEARSIARHNARQDRGGHVSV